MSRRSNECDNDASAFSLLDDVILVSLEKLVTVTPMANPAPKTTITRGTLIIAMTRYRTRVVLLVVLADAFLRRLLLSSLDLSRADDPPIPLALLEVAPIVDEVGARGRRCCILP